MNTFVIEYDPIGSNVRFFIRNSEGSCVNINDSEELKVYENECGLFNLEGQRDKIFKFLQENFDGEPEINIEIKTTPEGFAARRADFQRFDEAVKKFNKDSGINLILRINQFPHDNSSLMHSKPQFIQEDILTERDSFYPQREVMELTHASLNLVPDSIISTKSNPHLKKKIAVVGKIKSGKTHLITGMIDFLGSSYELCEKSMQYIDKKNGTEWYEVEGIDLGKQSIERTQIAIDGLIDSGVTIVLYCLHAMLGKIEDAERDLIVETRRKHPGVRVFAVITACVDGEKSQAFANVVSTATKQTRAFTVLAKEMSTKAGYLEPQGLAEMAAELFGEQTI